ncbi:MAG: hypothetical protein IPL20_00105 [Saprospiraceae bacterium]|nr:hypothetical protein [Saprospiraceae bacterium]
MGDNPEIKQVLNDLLIYFSAKDLLLGKFDATRIKNSLAQLKQIKHQSQLLEKLKEDIEYYKDFNVAFKETMNIILSLDKQKSSGGDSEIQKIKFNEIVGILINYMYNYYDYDRYPYLSAIMLEIIKIKKLNADADISHLLKKLG